MLHLFYIHQHMICKIICDAELHCRHCGQVVFSYLILELCAEKQKDYNKPKWGMSRIQKRAPIAGKRGRTLMFEETSARDGADAFS